MPLIVIRQVSVPDGVLWSWTDELGYWNDSLIRINFVKEQNYLARCLNEAQAATCFFDKPPLTDKQKKDTFDVGELLNRFAYESEIRFEKALLLLGPYADQARAIFQAEEPKPEFLTLKRVYELFETSNSKFNFGKKYTMAVFTCNKLSFFARW